MNKFLNKMVLNITYKDSTAYITLNDIKLTLNTNYLQCEENVFQISDGFIHIEQHNTDKSSYIIINVDKNHLEVCIECSPTSFIYNKKLVKTESEEIITLFKNIKLSF
jgi:hypothetical protein